MVTLPRVVSRVPPLYTRYPVTPTLSVEAFQERLTCEVEGEVAERLVGVLGAVRSRVVTKSTLEATLTLPAASMAETLSW